MRNGDRATGRQRRRRETERRGERRRRQSELLDIRERMKEARIERRIF